MTRTEKAALIADLRRQGHTVPQIAARLGMTRGGVRNLINDPDGSKQRARRDRYRGTCSTCGARTDGSNGRNAPTRCGPCTLQRQHDERGWTPTTILESFARFADVMGRPPASVDSQGLAPSIRAQLRPERLAEIHRARELGLTLPNYSVVHREFGSWPAALEAGGYPTNPGGRPKHRNREEAAA